MLTSVYISNVNLFRYMNHKYDLKCNQITIHSYNKHNISLDVDVIYHQIYHQRHFIYIYVS